MGGKASYVDSKSSNLNPANVGRAWGLPAAMHVKDQRTLAHADEDWDPRRLSPKCIVQPIPTHKKEMDTSKLSARNYGILTRSLSHLLTTYRPLTQSYP